MRILRTLLAAAALVALAVLLASCSGIREPEIELLSVDLVGITTEGLELRLTTSVENLNDFSAEIGRLEYRIYGDGEELAHGTRDEDVLVGAGEKIEVGVPFVLNWSGGKTILEGILDGDEHDWKLEGSVDVKKGPIRKTFTFSESGSINSPERPQDL